MKKLIASLILAPFICGTPALAQTEEDEIRLLISGAPVVQAMAKAEEMEGLVIANWLMALAYTGHTKEAFLTAIKIRKWMDEGEANCFIALGLAIAGKVDESISLLRRTKDPSTRTFIIEILAKNGRFSEALDEARKVGDADNRDDGLQQIAEELASRGEAKRALEVTGEIKNKKNLNAILRGVMMRLLKAGKIGEAKSIAETIQPYRSEQSPYQSAIFELASDLANDGDPEAALEMVDLIEDEAQRAWPLSVIAEAFTKAGSFDEALKAARRIRDESLLPIALADVAIGYVGKGEKDVARSLLNEAVGLARQINDRKKQDDLLFSLIPKFIESGFVDEASGLSDSFSAKVKSGNEVAATGDGLPSSIATDQVTVEGLLKAGKIDDALFFNEIALQRNPELRTQLKNYDWGNAH